MAIEQYTSAQEIRAALGVNSTELPDAVINLRLYSDMLDEALDTYNVRLVPLYVLTKSIPENERTKDQARFIRLVNLFATYSLCRILMSNVSMFAVKSLTDGKAEFERQSNVFDSLLAGIESVWTRLGSNLTALLAVLDPGNLPAPAAAPVLFVVSVPDRDPVTGAAGSAV